MVFLKNLLDMTLAKEQIFFLFSKIIFLLNQLLAKKLSALPNGFIKKLSSQTYFKLLFYNIFK